MTELLYETCDKCGMSIKGLKNIVQVRTGVSRTKDAFFRRYFSIFKSNNVLTTKYYHMECLKSNSGDPEVRHLEAQEYIKKQITTSK